MAFGRIDNYFESMRRVMEFRFVLPDDKRYMPNPEELNRPSNPGDPVIAANPHYSRPTKTVLLLNGYTHNNLEWLNHTQIMDLARMYNLAIFLPSGENGFYLNCEGKNDQFADYVGQELMEYVTKTFNLSPNREDHYVFGISMGGFGSLHTGLAYSDFFSKIVAFSPAYIIHEIAGAKPGFENAGGDYPYYRRYFGDLDTVLESKNNPEQLIRDLKAEGKDIPKIFLACGTEDFLIEHNRELKKFLVNENVPVDYFESPGMHDYNFWNQYVEKAIKWCLEDEK